MDEEVDRLTEWHQRGI